MPRKKKPGQSPARVPVPGLSDDATRGGGQSAVGPRRGGYEEGAMAGDLSLTPRSLKEDIVRNMKEMFSHLDPEVIYIVLSECGFKVEHAMDSLLELSVAAEVVAPHPGPASGFELTAAALLSPYPSDRGPDLDPPKPSELASFPLPTSPLTEELDLLIDKELETLTGQPKEGKKQLRSQYFSAVAAPLSSFPPPPVPQQALPELLQSSLEPGTTGPGTSGDPSPIDQLSFWEEKDVKKEECVLNYSHLILPGESAGAKPNASLDLGATGRPSAFQIYKKMDTASESSRGMPSGDNRGGVRSKVVPQTWHPPSSWNPESPVFSPRSHGNQAPTFITPVALPPSPWDTRGRPASHWSNQWPGSQGSPKPPDTIPKSWAPPAVPRASATHSRLRIEGKVLVLLRGAPGSGKSTLAWAMLEQNPGGVVLSTDDYFSRHGDYRFDPSALGEAHEWNHKRSQEAFARGASPIIIDNTNMQGWEMKPYVAQALRYNFKVLFREPDTWWKNKPRELARRNKHHVSVEKIRRILDGYERFVSIDTIMGSQPLNQPMSFNETLCPDLVGEPGFAHGTEKPHPYVFSSLPDVSSIGPSRETITATHSSQNSSEKKSQEIPQITNDGEDEVMDLLDSDMELEAHLELGSDQGVPDCIVESVLNEDQHDDEMPVAFSESIGQRVRRERGKRMAGLNGSQSVDLVEDTDQPGKVKELAEGDVGEVKQRPELLDFVGDWPSEECMEQRQVRRREKEQESGRGAKKHDSRIKPGPDVTELQKLLDLIQTSGDLTTSSPLDCLSSSSGEELERESNAGGGAQGSQGNEITGKDTEQNIHRSDSVRSELPDCVLDWKADELLVRESSESMLVESRGGKVELVENSSIEGIDPNPMVCRDMSLASEGSVETKGSTFSGGSQERKQRQGRRSGKQCKLALTFTQNCPSTAPNPLTDPTPNTTAPNQNSSHDTGCPTQTDPQDFAVLWRVNQHHSPGDTVVNAGIHPSDITVLTGDPFRFVPAVCSAVSATTAVYPPGHCEVPYRMVHEKGTQVEEQEVGVARSRLENLRILSRHFKLVSFDILEDLYDKCHQDLEWTTNLLLDSGERFFRDDDGEGKGYVWGEDEQNIATLCDTMERDLNIGLPSGANDERHPGDRPTSGALVDVEASLESASAEACSETVRTANECSDESHSNTESSGAGLKDICASRAKSQEISGSHGGISSHDTTTNRDHLGKRSNQNKSPQPLLTLLRKEENMEGGWDTGQEVTSEPISEKHKQKSSDEGTLFKNLGAKYGGDELSDIDLMTQLLLADIEEADKREEEQKVEERHSRRLLEEGRSRHLDIRSLELKLPTELALQLTELFGPVGIDAGACSSDDYSVHMDLNLAKLLHQKWKDTIQESQRQAALSYHLLQESSVHWGDSQPVKSGIQPADFLIGADGYASLGSQSEAQPDFPIMDHWNVSRTRVSLRDIMTEEHARQKTLEKTRQSRADLDRRDGATLLKENQLYDLFPGIDRHFLHDIFRDHNYCLMETQQFLTSLLDEGPVKTVMAPEVPHTEPYRAPSKEREKRPTLPDPVISQYQDMEDPEYEDFRAEASLQKRRQQENFAKAAEAFKQGKKDVASFYAQQGHLHVQKMREANHRAAMQIFKQVNSSLLPRNILDLHGLHVDEALQHMAQVLQDKTTEYQQGLCRPQLSVITGRGNHSQGGVARIRPAVIDYLTNKHYRFTEPKTGLILVSLN
ncbi:unnamed protein product [Merluccius merluccius]